MTRGTKLIVVMLAVVTLISGCVDDQKPKADSTAPTEKRLFQYWPTLLNNFRFRWSSELGIDVTTGPAMVVRAYLEAHDIATFTLDANNVYPGFMRATPENLTFKQAELLQQTYVRPLGEGYPTTPKDARAHFGYTISHFLELVPSGDGWAALVCEGTYPHFAASRVHPGKYVSVNADEVTAQPNKGVVKDEDLGVEPIRVTLTQHDPRVGPGAPADVTTPQGACVLARPRRFRQLVYYCGEFWRVGSKRRHPVVAVGPARTAESLQLRHAAERR